MERACAAEEDDDPVREPDEIRDVDAEPERPGRETALPSERPEPADVGDTRETADDGNVAVVAVAERLVRPADDAGGVRTPLHRSLGDARCRMVRLPWLDRRIADHEDLGMPRDRQVRLDQDAPRPICRGAGRR